MQSIQWVVQEGKKEVGQLMTGASDGIRIPLAF